MALSIDTGRTLTHIYDFMGRTYIKYDSITFCNGVAAQIGKFINNKYIYVNSTIATKCTWCHSKCHLCKCGYPLSTNIEGTLTTICDLDFNVLFEDIQITFDNKEKTIVTTINKQDYNGSDKFVEDYIYNYNNIQYGIRYKDSIKQLINIETFEVVLTNCTVLFDKYVEERVYTTNRATLYKLCDVLNKKYNIIADYVLQNERRDGVRGINPKQHATCIYKNYLYYSDGTSVKLPEAELCQKCSGEIEVSGNIICTCGCKDMCDLCAEEWRKQPFEHICKNHGEIVIYVQKL